MTQGDTADTADGWFDATTATFGDRTAAAREAAGMTQAELARRVGVAVKSIRAWEDDQSEPRANVLQRMAGVLGVSITWLLTGEGEGVETLASDSAVPEEVVDLLHELRGLRSEHARVGERLGRLEKRLRLSLAGMGLE